MSYEPDESGFPLNANGAAYTSHQERHGVPLTYVGEKLGSAIIELHRHARSRPAERGSLIPAMHYLLTAHLALHNMLGKADDHSLPERLLEGSGKELRLWLDVIAREGDVRGLSGIDNPRNQR